MRPLLSVSLLLALGAAGCLPAEYPDDWDGDGDGYSAKGDPEDCDDTDANIHPGADELSGAVCDDNEDNDCDGEVDNCDEDGDGHPSNLDCDDHDPLVNLAADEICDGKDTDCKDGLPADEADGDGDGFMECETCSPSASACEWAEWVVGGGDCDDEDPYTFPGGEDVCNTAADEDCDGIYLECDLLEDEYDLEGDAHASWTGDAGGGPVGLALSSAGPGLIAIGEAQESTVEYEAGALYVIDGPFAGDHLLPDDVGTWLGCHYRDRAGTSLAVLSHWGASEEPALIVGAKGSINQTTPSLGRAYVLAEPQLGAGSLEDADLQLVGENEGDKLGIRVSSAGDQDGDGIEDLLVGAHQAAPDGLSVGGAYLVSGGLGGEIELADGAHVLIHGASAGDFAGQDVACAGDVDGDGQDDLLIGATGVDESAGAAYLLLGPVTAGPIDLGLTYDARWTGEAGGDLAGYRVSTAGDVSSQPDGLADLLIAAHSAEGGQGAVYLVYGSAALTRDNSLADAPTVIAPCPGSTQAGCDVVGGEDVNGDQIPDLLVGAPGAEVERGAAYLFYGPVAEGQLDAADDADAVFLGDDPGEFAGSAVAFAGDLNGDGLQDILVGAAGAADGEGKVYLLYGGDSE